MKLWSTHVPLVVVADDYGISIDRSRGIIHSMLCGIVTNTSIMANMCTADPSLDLLRSNGLLERVGLHLNLSEGTPLSAPSEIPSLVIASGTSSPRFLGKAGFQNACRDGKIRVEHVRIEARAQLEWFNRNVGHPPIHVDSHQHVHVLPLLVDTLATLFVDMGVTFVRTPTNTAHTTDRRPPCSVCSVVSSNGATARIRFRTHGLCCLDTFVGLSFCGTRYTMAQIVGIVDARIAAGACSIEMMVHPGFPELAEPTTPCTENCDSFNTSDDRFAELTTLCTPGFPSCIHPNVRLAYFAELLS